MHFDPGCRTVSNNGSGLGFSSCSKYFSGSGLVRVHLSTIFEVQVWFRFTQVKYYWFRFGFIDLKFNCRYSFRPEKKKDELLILLTITTALVVRVPAPAASGNGKMYSYF